MVAISQILKLSAIGALAGSAFAHPGHDPTQEIAERSAYLKTAKRDLSHCAKRMEDSGLSQRATLRRQATVQRLKARNALKKRQPVPQAATTTASASMPSGSAPSGGFPSGSGGMPGGGAVSLSPYGSAVVNTSHQSNLSVTPDSDESIIFGNHSCVLNPEGEVGPFYVTGEYIRTDIAEDQPGVPMTIDGQFIDINTCEPIVDLYWDVWHCNSSGVYGGVLGMGNGNSADLTNINNTFLRGLQPTDDEGVAQFDSLFPGHYAGRTTHVHVVSHMNGTVLANGTYQGGDITHIGQLFFDQELIDDVNANVSPYNENTIAIVENADDRVFAGEAENDSDPVFDWVSLGDDMEDGLFMWITMGIDPSASYTASAAANYGEGGGVAT